MQIYGLNKTTLLDFPEHVAATVFTGGCNFCCPFCHNKDLVLQPQEYPRIDEEEVFAFLKKRRGVLSGVCITGGEPTLQKDLPGFIKKVKELGYLVKLDTNGYRPDVLKGLLHDGLLDYVAMDIKNSKKRYPETAGKDNLDVARIEKSAELLMTGSIPYEFRTTVTKQLHDEHAFAEIGEWLSGADAYFLQAYRDSENVIERKFSSYKKEELEAFAEILKKTIHRVEMRGLE